MGNNENKSILGDLGSVDVKVGFSWNIAAVLIVAFCTISLGYFLMKKYI